VLKQALSSLQKSFSDWAVSLLGAEFRTGPNLEADENTKAITTTKRRKTTNRIFFTLIIGNQLT
jgi:hypothetical protein